MYHLYLCFMISWLAPATAQEPGEVLLQFRAAAAQADQVQSRLDNVEIDMDTLALLLGATDSFTHLSPNAPVWSEWEVAANVSTAGHEDEAVVWKQKNSATPTCIAAFAGTNDRTDKNNVMGGFAEPPQTVCGMPFIHAGVAREFDNLRMTASWSEFTNALQTCSSVIVGGHSLGGAVASVFAGCASRGHADAGSVTPDVSLVTVAPLAASIIPITRADGSPFNGVRYGITDDQCSQDPTFNLTIAQKADLYKQSVELIQMFCPSIMRLPDIASSPMLTGQFTYLCSTLGGAIQFMSAMNAAENYQATFAFLDQMMTAGLVHASLPMVQLGAYLPLLGNDLLAIQHKVVQMWMLHYLDNPTDPIQHLGGMFGFQHASTPFVAMRNPLWQHDSNAPIECQNHSPTADYYQTFWRMLLAQVVAGEFWDHDICCYHSDHVACENLYTYTYAEPSTRKYCSGGQAPQRLLQMIGLMQR